MRNYLDAVQSWYEAQCDGDWEHQYGVKIETIDNPGWAVKIDLAGTKLWGKPLAETVEDRTETDWIRCSVSDGRFEGYGGPKNLADILERFIAFAESHK
jgi:hypothetical protein